MGCYVRKSRIIKLAAAFMGVMLLLTVNSCDVPAPTQAADPQGSATASGERFGTPIHLKLRWGGAVVSPATVGRATVRRASLWNGELRLDCGRITNLRFVGGEAEEADGLGDLRRDGQGTRVAWRSTVRGDHEGVEATLLPCLGAAGSTLQVTTPRRTWRARLLWSRDEFVSLPVGDRGERLEIRLRLAPSQ